MTYYRKKAVTVDYTKEEFTKCWTCKNACGGCCWSQEFKPVPGWKAEKTVFYDCGEKVESYHVVECPEYKLG